MALIIEGKSVCPLCNKTMNKGDKITAFPAFIPYDHKYGRFSDAAFHTECFVKDPDHAAIEDMLTAWKMIMDSRPRDLKSMAQIDEWTREAFKDWPPKNGVVIFQPLFPDDSDEGGFWMDADQYEEMCKAEEEHEREMEARREEAYRREREAWRYSRDDD